LGLDVWALTSEEKKNGLRPIDPRRCFRDTYGPRSLANWLARNVDPRARGDWGLAILTEPPTTLNSPEWRLRFYRKTMTWRNWASAFSGRISLAGYPEDLPLIITPTETDQHLEALEDLYEFARLVWKNGLEVHISS